MSAEALSDLVFQFSHQRDEDKKSTAILLVTFPEALTPKKDVTIETMIEYLPPEANPVPHQGKISTMRSGRTSVFDPETKTWDAIPSPTTVSIYFVQQILEGILSIYLQWTDEEDTKHARTYRTEAGHVLNRAVTEELEPYAPSLSAHLKETVPPHPRQGLEGTGSGAEGHAVGVVLRHLYTRLRWGFGNFWAAQGPRALYEGRPLCEVPDGELRSLTAAQLDELWAQLVSENLVGTCYQGPGSFMAATWAVPEITGTSDQHSRDAEFMRQATILIGRDNPFIPVVFACQQLCSWAIFYRGHTEVSENPLDAELWGTTGNIDGAARRTGTQGHITGKKLQEQSFLRAGACVYRGRASEAMAVRHVGVLLRADESTNSFQMGDTGGWVSSDFGSGQNFDTGSLTRLRYPSDALLVPPRAADRVDGLLNGVRALRRARPLAAGQLLIARRSAGSFDDRIIWSSRMLHLHEDSGVERDCYPISKLSHSLRHLPFSAALEVRWRVWAPVGDSVQAAVEAERDWLAGDAVRVKEVLELGSTSDGSFRVLQSTKQHLGSGPPPPDPNFTRSEAGTALAAAGLGAIPEYFS